MKIAKKSIFSFSLIFLSPEPKRHFLRVQRIRSSECSIGAHPQPSWVAKYNRSSESSSGQDKGRGPTNPRMAAEKTYVVWKRFYSRNEHGRYFYYLHQHINTVLTC